MGILGVQRVIQGSTIGLSKGATRSLDYSPVESRGV